MEQHTTRTAKYNNDTRQAISNNMRQKRQGKTKRRQKGHNSVQWRHGRAQHYHIGSAHSKKSRVASTKHQNATAVLPVPLDSRAVTTDK